MKYFASKGLFIREVSNNTYIIEDVLGNSSSHFTSSEEDLDTITKSLANTQKLTTVCIESEFPNYSDFGWDKLEKHYLTNIDYALLHCLLSPDEQKHHHQVIGLLPLGYLECGYGDGSKNILELIHQNSLKHYNEGSSLIQEKNLNTFLVLKQVERVCDDIISLMKRSITAYVELLNSHRNCIVKSHVAIGQLGSNEIIHRGNDTYKSASAVTSLVISICSSLDLSAKLIQFINSINPLNIVYKGIRDKQYHEIKKIKPSLISGQALKSIVLLQNTNSQIPELIQFRNDLIHSTSAIELERIYVGFETDEIKKQPLYYSAQYARDTLDSGQPVRFLGRDYFTEDKVDIEVKALEWIRSVLDHHVQVGDYLNSYLKSLKKQNA